MNCFPELTYSIYLDRELPAEETLAVESHLVECPACRARVERLRVENRLLAEALEETADVSTAIAPARHGLPVAWLLPAMLGGVIALSWTVRWLSSCFPTSANWMNPFSRTALLNMLLSGAFFLNDQRGLIIHWFALAITGIAVGLLIVAAVYVLIRRWPLHVALLGAALLVAGLAKPTYAMESRSSRQTVTVPPSETVNGNLVAGAQIVEIAGKINGNLIAHGQRITISGTVTGDVITGSQTLDIEGTVEGNVYAWAQFVTVRGKVEQTLYAFAGSVQLANGGQVGGDVLAGSGSLDVNGTVGGDVDARVDSLSVDGNVGRNINFGGGQLTLASSARVGNNLIAKVKRTSDVSIQQGAVIGGKTNVKLSGNNISRFLTVRFYLWKVVHLAAIWIAGLVLFWLVPTLYRGRIDNSTDLLKAVGWGFVVLVATPVAAVIVGLTVVGLPLAIFGMVLWVVGLYLAKLFLASVIGRRVTGAYGESGKAFAGSLLLGLVIVYVVIELPVPYVGTGAWILITLLGFGLVLGALRGAWAGRTPWARSSAVTRGA